MTEATDDDAAWNLVSSDSTLQIDDVVSDISMPNMNGFQLLEKLRTKVRFEKTPFILELIKKIQALI